MSDQADDGIDWTGVDIEMAREIKGQGERFMEAQLQSALASDQRSATMAGIFTAIATAMIAGAIAYWDKSGSASILAAGMAGGLWMMIGVGLCLWGARPIDFYFPGNHPAQWYDCRHESLVEAIGGEAENYQVRIERNDARLVKMGKTLRGGAVLVCTAPVAAVAAFWIATWISSPQESRPASSPQTYSVPAKAPSPQQISHPSMPSGPSKPATQR